MNYSMAIFLINSHARAMACTYEADEGAKRTLFKTLDPNIKEGDYVIVATGTRHGMTVVKVIEADVDVDFDAPDKVEWIVGSVDRAQHERLLEHEKEAIQAIKSAELRKKREELRAAMFADHVETLKALPIAAINGDDEEQEVKTTYTQYSR